MFPLYSDFLHFEVSLVSQFFFFLFLRFMKDRYGIRICTAVSFLTLACFKYLLYCILCLRYFFCTPLSFHFCTIIHFRFLPFFFVLGAAVEFSMINWTVRDTNFYKTFKKRQGKDHVYTNVKGFSLLRYIFRFTHLPVLRLFA